MCHTVTLSHCPLSTVHCPVSHGPIPCVHCHCQLGAQPQRAAPSPGLLSCGPPRGRPHHARAMQQAPCLSPSPPGTTVQPAPHLLSPLPRPRCASADQASVPSEGPEPREVSDSDCSGRTPVPEPRNTPLANTPPKVRIILFGYFLF